VIAWKHATMIILSAAVMGCRSPVEHQRLTPTDPVVSDSDDIEAIALSCSGCHADEARPGIPALSGLSSGDLYDSLSSYKRSTDGSTVMHRIARGYSDEELQRLAEHFGEES